MIAKEQINNASGDFQHLHILSCGQKEVELNEGSFHIGKAHVLRLIGQKI